MTAIETDTAHDSELDGVLQWRYEQLVRSGYDTSDALDLACNFEIDLHFAADLVRRGCPSATAVRIAA